MFEQTAMQDPAGFLAAVTEQLAKLPSQLWRTGNEGFAPIAAAMDALAVQLDCARVGLVDEAVSRGVVDASPSASAADWLMAHSFHLEPAEAVRAVELARHCALPKNQVLAAAVASGSVTVRKAMTALRQVGQVEHALAPGKREEALASLTQMAQSGYDRNVIAVGRSLMALVGADRALERNEHMLAALSCLRLSPMDNGMVRVSGQLDPEAGAVLTAALDPLSAPNPCEANGGRDPRPPERRRAEALIEVCRRAAAAGGAAPATSKAQIVVTIGYDRLADALRGAGTTLGGAVLAPEAVRRPACDASIIPMVLGSMSQPLDVGRTNPPQAGGAPRLVTLAPAGRVMGPGQGLHLPRLRAAASMVRRPPRRTLARRRTNILTEPGPVVCPPPSPSLRWGDPHLGPSTRPDHHRHRPRRHLADLTDLTSPSFSSPCSTRLPLSEPRPGSRYLP